VKINGSKRGEVNYTPPYSTGLLKPPHARRFGVTVSLFMAFEDRVTGGEGTDGFVLGGKPVTDEEFAKSFGVHPKSIAATRRKLERWGYIQTKRAKGGAYTVVVKKSKKWVLLKRLRKNESAPNGSEYAPTRSEYALAEGSLPIDDKAVTRQGQRRKKPASRASHPLHDEIRTWCAGEWERRFGEKPPWDGRDNKALQELLQARPDLTLPRIQQVWANYAESSKTFYDDSGWPLWAFCKDFAGLSLHPVHDRGVKHAKSTASGKPNRFRGVERPASEFAQHTH
jgi:hypothetical protein